MKADQLRLYVVRPTLIYLNLYSPPAEELVMLTGAQESHEGEYIHQTGKGPALGIFEMEPHTHDNHWATTLARRPDLAAKVRSLVGTWHNNGIVDAKEMIGNLYYATAMCRIHYLPITQALPEVNDVAGMAQYYKKYYNTYLGAATIEEVIENYRKYVTGE